MFFIDDKVPLVNCAIFVSLNTSSMLLPIEPLTIVGSSLIDRDAVTVSLPIVPTPFIFFTAFANQVTISVFSAISKLAIIHPIMPYFSAFAFELIIDPVSLLLFQILAKCGYAFALSFV